MTSAVGAVEVTSAADPRVGDFVGLRDRQLVADARRAHRPGIFIAEGELVVRRLLAGAHQVRAVLVTPTRLAAMAEVLRSATAPVYVAGQAVMDQVAGFEIHRGVLASVDRWELPTPADLASRTDLLLAVEGVNDHENMGALFRNAAAFGVGGVVLDPTSADPLYRRSVRVSMGHVLDVAFTRVGRWPTDLVELARDGWEVLALTPEAGAEPVGALEPGGRRIVMVGAEGPGLSEVARAGAHRRIRIPMADGVDSLNVATAAAVALSRLGACR